jgi:hypothetical protein
MKVLEPGHLYQLACLDGDKVEFLQFVKRIGDHYPGNRPPAWPGTTMQEVLRALIERAQYVNRQIPCAETEAAIGLLSAALFLFEVRAKRVKGKTLDLPTLGAAVLGDTCGECGHVRCDEAHALPPLPAAATEEASAKPQDRDNF